MWRRVKWIYLILLSVYSMTALALNIESGIWKGTAELHNKRAENVEFEVIDKQGELTIIMFYKEAMYPFENLKLSDDYLQFDLDMGTVYSCKLKEISNQILEDNCPTKDKDSARSIKLEMIVPDTLVQKSSDAAEEKQNSDEPVEPESKDNSAKDDARSRLNESLEFRTF